MSSISTMDENVIVQEFSSMKSVHSSRYSLVKKIKRCIILYLLAQKITKIIMVFAREKIQQHLNEIR